ncbi:hypothetical protein C8J57DRAFT_1394657 [Mycena rebaudengoi]|nr:hypothetical protein C8J57DRAFT_1405986 [Mycena rebaudengoi]KAJ7218713.1 hypothetical protein C8J57DRAFT_1394657 [Mycena rebaudengoi]
MHDALLIVAHRVRLMVQKCALNTSAMLAPNPAADAITPVLHNHPYLSYNSPAACVLSGPVVQLHALEMQLDSGAGDVRRKSARCCHAVRVSQRHDDFV